MTTTRENFTEELMRRVSSRITASLELRDIRDFTIHHHENNIGFYLRIEFQVFHIPERMTVLVSLDPFLMRTVTDHSLNEMTAYVISDFTRSVREFLRERGRENMAQWNQRPDQRLRQQESQRREARGQQPLEPIEGGGVEGGRITFNTRDYIQEFRDQEVREARERERERQRVQNQMWGGNNATMSVGTMANMTYVTTPGIGNTTNWHNVATPVQLEPRVDISTPESVKALLLEMLKDGLTINLSMDESDGEVSASVEILFNGEFIASDSDSIQL